MQMASGMMSMSSAPGSGSRALRAFATSLGMALAFRGALHKHMMYQCKTLSASSVSSLRQSTQALRPDSTADMALTFKSPLLYKQSSTATCGHS